MISISIRQARPPGFSLSVSARAGGHPLSCPYWQTWKGPSQRLDPGVMKTPSP